MASTSVKIGTIQRRLAWPLRKDDTLYLRRIRYLYLAIFSCFQVWLFIKMPSTHVLLLKGLVIINKWSARLALLLAQGPNRTRHFLGPAKVD